MPDPARLTGMAQCGISGNLMSLGAIEFGLIIDGSVVIIENILRHVAKKQHGLGMRLARLIESLPEPLRQELDRHAYPRRRRSRGREARAKRHANH